MGTDTAGARVDTSTGSWSVRGRVVPAGSAFAGFAVACVLSLALVAGACAVAGCSNGESDRSDDADTSVSATGAGLVEEDRSWVTEKPEVYVGAYSGRFQRFFEGRGQASVPLTMTITARRVDASWDAIVDVPGDEPLRWHTNGRFAADVLEDGTFEGEGIAVTFTTGASRDGTETPQVIRVAGRLSDDALILGDLIFEEGPLTFQAVREAE